MAARRDNSVNFLSFSLNLIKVGCTELRKKRRFLPPARREGFRWTNLLAAPVIALPLADAEAYTERYSEPDKLRTGLGSGAESWPVPYWTVDTSMSVMTILLGAEELGLGAEREAVEGHDAGRAQLLDLTGREIDSRQGFEGGVPGGLVMVFHVTGL